MQELLDNLAKRAPKAVENLVPGTLSLGVVQKVLQNLVQRGRVHPRPADHRGDPGRLRPGHPGHRTQLTEYVRGAWAAPSSSPTWPQDGTLPILTLDHTVEGSCRKACARPTPGSYLALEPGLAQKIIKHHQQGRGIGPVGVDGQPVLLDHPVVRPHLAQLAGIRFLPSLPVMSQAEIPADVKIQSVASVVLS